jgi:hypothetical protein
MSDETPSHFFSVSESFRLERKISAIRHEKEEGRNFCRLKKETSVSIEQC